MGDTMRLGRKTLESIERFEGLGYTIIMNGVGATTGADRADPELMQELRYRYYMVSVIARSYHRKHGYLTRIIVAVAGPKPAELQRAERELDAAIGKWRGAVLALHKALMKMQGFLIFLPFFCPGDPIIGSGCIAERTRRHKKKLTALPAQRMEVLPVKADILTRGGT